METSIFDLMFVFACLHVFLTDDVDERFGIFLMIMKFIRATKFMETRIIW